MITWSPSAILSARACPLQWLRLYGHRTARERLQPGDSIAHLAIGVAEHAALEAAYKRAQRGFGYQPGRSMSHYLDVAIGVLADQWQSLRLPEDYAAQAQAIAEVGATLEALPMPNHLTILGVEEEIYFTGRSGTPFKARLDLVLRTGFVEIHIRDWKRTSISQLPKPQELLDDVQLCQQRVAVSERWPWARRVTVGLFSIRSAMETQPIEFPLERALYQLDGHEVTAHDMEQAGSHPPRTGPACGICRVRPQCPAWPS
jgi:hypothetical protein